MGSPTTSLAFAVLPSLRTPTATPASSYTTWKGLGQAVRHEWTVSQQSGQRQLALPGPCRSSTAGLWTKVMTCSRGQQKLGTQQQSSPPHPAWPACRCRHTPPTAVQTPAAGAVLQLVGARRGGSASSPDTATLCPFNLHCQLSCKHRKPYRRAQSTLLRCLLLRCAVLCCATLCCATLCSPAAARPGRTAGRCRAR